MPIPINFDEVPVPTPLSGSGLMVNQCDRGPYDEPCCGNGRNCWIKYKLCVLSWSCDADARVLFGTDVISEANSGTIFAPENGVYTLQVWDGTTWKQVRLPVIIADNESCNDGTVICCSELGGHYAVETAVSHVSGLTALFAWANGSWAHNWSANPFGNQSCRWGAQYGFPTYFSSPGVVSGLAILVYEHYHSPAVRSRFFKGSVTTYSQPAFLTSGGFPDYSMACYVGGTISIYAMLEAFGGGTWNPVPNGASYCGGFGFLNFAGTVAACTKYPTYYQFLAGYKASATCSPYSYINFTDVLTDCTVELSIE